MSIYHNDFIILCHKDTKAQSCTKSMKLIGNLVKLRVFVPWWQEIILSVFKI